MKFSWYSSPLTDLNASVTLCALMVMPRSRSRSMRVEHLGLHLPRVETAAFLDESIGQSRFAVINMSNDGKIADILHLGLGAVGKPAIIPVGDGMRGPYALLRGPDAHGTPIRRRAAAPESCVRSALWRRDRASTSTTSTPALPRAAGNAASSRSISSHRPHPGREYSRKRAMRGQWRGSSAAAEGS